jgi:hypothetical protein
MEFNISLCKFALKNHLHVEYFIWSYLRTISSCGFYDISVLEKSGILESTRKRKLKDNFFFSVTQSKIIIKSVKKLKDHMGRRCYSCDAATLNKFARKVSAKSDKIIKGWNDTTIQYLMISIVGCQYGENKPYALPLIKEDTGCSISTIQRALKNIFVSKDHTFQKNPTMRSYFYKDKTVYLSPNYNQLTIGKIYTKF